MEFPRIQFFTPEGAEATFKLPKIQTLMLSCPLKNWGTTLNRIENIIQTFTAKKFYTLEPQIDTSLKKVK